MEYRKFSIGQRVLVRDAIDPSFSGEATDNVQEINPNTISELLAPEMSIRGKKGTVLAYIQPVWDHHVAVGDGPLNQYQVDVDNVGARLVLEPWLDSNSVGLQVP
jgi:hypothetical protein